MSFIHQHSGAIVWSVALHIAVAAGFAIGLPMPERPRVAVAAAPIQGTIVDQAAIERERETREQADRRERQRLQRADRERREAADKQHVADEREQQRVADAQRAREVTAQKERERVAADKREEQAREQRERDAAAKREREQAEQLRRQRQAEAELQQQLDIENEQNAARAAGLLDQYIRLIENRIKQHWDRPLSARPGLDCVVNVVQLPTGDVVSAKVASCNGDDAVRRSIERAVMDASPLPKAPAAALFERSLNVSFRPDE